MWKLLIAIIVLGVGGMGVVVAAVNIMLDQRVALKFMLPEAMQIREAVDRFLREARAAVRLKSEHVARIIDVGTLETGSPYIVLFETAYPLPEPFEIILFRIKNGQLDQPVAVRMHSSLV